MIRPLYAWLALLIVWLAFFGWYTSFAGPLTPEEIATVMEFAEAGDVAPEDIAKTVYHAMGIDDLTAIDKGGRPYNLMAEGRPILELF